MVPLGRRQNAHVNSTAADSNGIRIRRWPRSKAKRHLPLKTTHPDGGVVLFAFSASKRRPVLYPALRSKCFQQLRYVFGGLYLLQDRLYFPVGADEVGSPIGTRAFPGPGMIRFHDVLIRVAQERKGKTMLFDEFLVTFSAICADAKKFHLRLKFTP